MIMKHKPEPIKTSLTRKKRKKVAVATPIPEEASPVFNEDSPLVTKQIEALQKDVRTLRSAKPNEAQTLPPAVVNIPARARIAKITIKYDQLGFPHEMIPHYVEAGG